MRKSIDKTEWTEFVRSYSARNSGRPTRLGVFEFRDGVADDYWIEDGLPLLALDSYPDQKGKTRIDILFDTYTHSIDGAESLACIDDAADHGLDITDDNGKTTVLRFEDWSLNHGE